jgi:hypothetical protein
MLEKKTKSLFRTLTFKGVALAAFSATVFPYVSKPVENILIDSFPRYKVLIVNGLTIAGSLIGAVGGTLALKGRIDVGDVTTPPYLYGPNSLPSTELIRESGEADIDDKPKERH